MANNDNDNGYPGAYTCPPPMPGYPAAGYPPPNFPPPYGYPAPWPGPSYGQPPAYGYPPPYGPMMPPATDPNSSMMSMLLPLVFVLPALREARTLSASLQQKLKDLGNPPTDPALLVTWLNGLRDVISTELGSEQSVYGALGQQALFQMILSMTQQSSFAGGVNSTPSMLFLLLALTGNTLTG
jgi:hypothetical protein